MQAMGIDLGSINRIQAIINNYDSNTLNYLYSNNEIAHCQSGLHPAVSYTVSFCTKEAVGKAFGTGLAGLYWYEIEALPFDNKVIITLSGSALSRAKEVGISRWLTSYSVCGDLVYVVVIGQ